MGKISKTFALILTFIIAMSCLTLLTVKSANAQTIPTPSVPQFTVMLVNHFEGMPTTTMIDPFSGERLVVPATHYEWHTLDIMIKNQPFTQYKVEDNGYNWTVNLQYNIRLKNDPEQTWTELYNANSNQAYPTQNYTGEYTTISFNLGGQNYPTSESNLRLLWNFTSNILNFQVEALIGYSYTVIGSEPTFKGTVSDWSPIQTITIPASSVSPNPTSTITPTSTPTIPELSWLMIVPLLLSMFSVTVVLRYRKDKYG